MRASLAAGWNEASLRTSTSVLGMPIDDFAHVALRLAELRHHRVEILNCARVEIDPFHVLDKRE